MLGKLQPRLTYANVTATLALFLALGGGAYAAIDLVGRKDIKSKHIAPGAVKRSDTNTTLRLKCPAGTQYHEGACIETANHPALAQNSASNNCGSEGGRLPSVAELQNFAREPGITLDENGEWSSDYFDADTPVIVFDNSEVESELVSNPHVYRCAFPARR